MKFPAQLQLWTATDFSSNYMTRVLSELTRRMEGWNVVKMAKSPEPQGGRTIAGEKPNAAVATAEEKKADPVQTTAPANTASRSDRLAALQETMKHSAEAADKENARRWASMIELTGKETPSPEQPIAFVSYSREDSEFVQRLAQDLRKPVRVRGYGWTSWT